MEERWQPDTCAGVCSVLWKRHAPREAGIPEPAASQNPTTSVRAGPGFERPQMQLGAACAVWNLSKPSSHSHPPAPCRQCGAVSLSSQLFIPRLNDAWQTTNVEMGAATRDGLNNVLGVPKTHYCGNDKMPRSLLNILL